MELIIRAIFTVTGGREGGVGRGYTEGVVITQVMEGQQQRKLSVSGCWCVCVCVWGRGKMLRGGEGFSRERAW